MKNIMTNPPISNENENHRVHLSWKCLGQYIVTYIDKVLLLLEFPQPVFNLPQDRMPLVYYTKFFFFLIRQFYILIFLKTP